MERTVRDREVAGSNPVTPILTIGSIPDRILNILVWFLLLCVLPIFPSTGNSGDFQKSERALFVSVIQDPPALSSKHEIKELIDYSRKANIRTLFVQIYRSGKAWFPSKIADSSPYDANLQATGEDSFQYLIEEAHASGIEVHAWLNMLSLSANQDAPLLKKYGPEILTRNTRNKQSIQDYKIDNQYFLEPGDLRVRSELAEMVGEILKTYPELDGIQFDYIRYPDEDPRYGYTDMNMKRFKEATGLDSIDEESNAWKDWKRAQVTEFLELLIKTAKSVRPEITISTTGCMPYIRAYYEAFQNWPLWVNRGLIDFVTLMTYPEDVSEFEKYLSDVKARIENFKKIWVALPAYKAIDNPKIFFEEWRLCEEFNGGACVVFHFGSLTASKELYEFVASSD